MTRNTPKKYEFYDLEVVYEDGEVVAGRIDGKELDHLEERSEDIMHDMIILYDIHGGMIGIHKDKMVTFTADPVSGYVANDNDPQELSFG